MSIPILLIHGYSDQGASYKVWAEKLRAAGRDVRVCSYKTLTNEVSIKDIAEGFDRALRLEAGLQAGEAFDAMVHSTGMLVLRAWLASSNQDRYKRLKHLIGLAPASFGSPLAHKGRSWLGVAIKGNHQLGQDFLEAGDKVLDALELGGRFTWDLAHLDILKSNSHFGPGPDTPYVFTFCGTQKFKGLRSGINLFVDTKGTDGATRLAGCPLNSRKITLDLTMAPDEGAKPQLTLAEWCNQNIPLIPREDHNHETILIDPSEALVTLVLKALSVSSEADLSRWLTQALPAKSDWDRQTAKIGLWQQFVVRVVDERGDPIPDYNLQLCRAADRRWLKEFVEDVHVYSRDKSLRCFHARLDKLDLETPFDLELYLNASSGSDLVGYYGVGSERFETLGLADHPPRSNELWDAVFKFSTKTLISPT